MPAGSLTPYPNLPRFQALRDELDPDRHFANPFTDQLLS